MLDILEFLDDMEDGCMALERLENQQKKWKQKELEAELDLEEQIDLSHNPSSWRPRA